MRDVWILLVLQKDTCAVQSLKDVSVKPFLAELALVNNTLSVLCCTVPSSEEGPNASSA